MSLDFTGAKKAFLTIDYTFDGTDISETVTLDREELERNANKNHGAANMLDPNWVKMTDQMFSRITMNALDALADSFIPVPIDPDNAPEGLPVLTDGLVFISSSNIRKVTVMTERQIN